MPERTAVCECAHLRAGGESREKTHLCSFVWAWHHEVVLCLVLGHHPRRLTIFGYLPGSADKIEIKTTEEGNSGVQGDNKHQGILVCRWEMISAP